MNRIEDDRYTTVAIALHWLIAVLVLANIALGVGHEWVPRETARPMMWWHKSSGMLILFLTILRILWRVFHR